MDSIQIFEKIKKEMTHTFEKEYKRKKVNNATNRQLFENSVNSFLNQLSTTNLLKGEKLESVRVYAGNKGDILIELLPAFKNFTKEEQIKIAMRLYGISESAREDFEFVFNNLGYIDCIRLKQSVEYLEFTVEFPEGMIIKNEEITFNQEDFESLNNIGGEQA